MDEGVLAKVLVLGNIASGKSTFANALGAALGWTRFGIDEARRTLGDGSPAGEARAWAAFLERAEHGTGVILECAGAGPFVGLLRLALQRSGHAWTVLWVDTPLEECLARVDVRGVGATPYPSFGEPLRQVMPRVAQGLAQALEMFWPPALCRIDGTARTEVEVARATEAVSTWLRQGPPS